MAQSCSAFVLVSITCFLSVSPLVHQITRVYMTSNTGNEWWTHQLGLVAKCSWFSSDSWYQILKFWFIAYHQGELVSEEKFGRARKRLDTAVQGAIICQNLHGLHVKDWNEWKTLASAKLQEGSTYLPNSNLHVNHLPGKLSILRHLRTFASFQAFLFVLLYFWTKLRELNCNSKPSENFG